MGGLLGRGKMKKTSIHGGPTVTICGFCLRGEGGASWGEDNQIIATLGEPFGLYRIDAVGGVPHLLAKAADRKALWIGWPQILPGGESVLYTASERLKTFEEARIEVLSLKSGQAKTLQERAYFGRYLPTGHLIWVRD